MAELIKFYDCNMYLGRPTRAVFQPAASASELLAALDGYGIQQALVWHVAQRDVHPAEGNRLIADLCGGGSRTAPTGIAHARLRGCWTILPPQTGEVIDDGFFERMKDSGVVALRAFPEQHRYLLNRVTFGAFLDQVSQRRIPLLLSLSGDNRGWSSVYALLEQYPSLTLVLCDIGIWGADRYIWPLLETYPHTLVESSLLALEDGGTEALVARYGAGRVLFGSGFPERYPESAILQLLHADIAEADKARIAAGNLEALIAGIDM